MSKEISFDERRRVQLEMLDEIDSFCKAHQIRYSIAFGTLLGAVRHKGFIPWDDDVDIMMPLPDLLRFKKLFHSDNMEYVDVDVSPYFSYAFSRVVDKKSYSRDGMFFKGHGICIDIYVLVGLNDLEYYFANAWPIYSNRINMMKWRRRIIKLFPCSTIPGFTRQIKKYRDYMFNASSEYGDSKFYYIIAGPLRIREKMIYDRDLFSRIIPLQFEDRVYLAISDYDYFLTLRYGDYMQLPPEDQRHPYHAGHYYWT